jgi:hypothetical protein
MTNCSDVTVASECLHSDSPIPAPAAGERNRRYADPEAPPRTDGYGRCCWRRRRVRSVFKLEARVADVLKAKPPIFLQATRQQAANLDRRVGWKPRHRRIRFHDRRQRFGDVLAAERAGAGQHFEEHATKGPDVRASIENSAARLFRRHVGRPCRESSPHASSAPGE